MQNLYNLLYREEEREMMPTLKVRFSPATLLGPTKHSVTMEQLFGVRSIPWSLSGAVCCVVHLTLWRRYARRLTGKRERWSSIGRLADMRDPSYMGIYDTSFLETLTNR